jgi:hypothetical protein
VVFHSTERVPNREELRKVIKTAFATVEYPGDEHLVYDTSGYHLECNQISAIFRGRHWLQLASEMLRKESSALYFMTPAAYRYYLPAYIIECIMNYEQADVIPETVVHSLIAPCDEKALEAYRRRMESFTPVQLKAILTFLRYMEANHQEDNALGDFDHALKSVVAWLGTENDRNEENRQGGRG